MDYESLQAAVRDGTIGRAAPRWAFEALDDIAEGRTSVAAKRHPLGFVCIPVRRAGGRGVCVHVWSDSLPGASPTTSMVHAHSWNLTSYVLYGSLGNQVIDVTDTVERAMCRVFEVRSNGDVDEMRETPRLVRYEVAATDLNHEGDVYSLPAGAFHATVVRGEAATVALGFPRPGTLDLSLGGIDTRTHRIPRQRCDRDETAAAARVVLRRLASVRTIE